MATPSLKMRTEWCLSRRSSERTTPPNRGPTSGEPPANLEPQQPFSHGDIWSLTGGEDGVRACATSTGWICGHEYKTERVEWHGVVFGKKKGEKKTRNMTWRCSLSAVVVHPTDMMSTALSEQPVVSSSSLFSLSLSEWKSSKIASFNWNPICGI